MSKQRYEITGEWSGPISPAGKWTRVCHREVSTDHKLVLFINGVGCVRFSDGTSLFLNARPMVKGERLSKSLIDGYGSLIRDCARFGVDSVEALVAAKKAQKALQPA